MPLPYRTPRLREMALTEEEEEELELEHERQFVGLWRAHGLDPYEDSCTVELLRELEALSDRTKAKRLGRY